jgi:hypothetical protein
VAGVKPGEDHDVIPSLLDLLGEKVRKAEVTRREITTNFPRDRRTISRYLNGHGGTTARELDAFVTAVAVELEDDRLDLWQEAIDLVRERIAQNGGRDRRQGPAEIARATRLRDQD